MIDWLFSPIDLSRDHDVEFLVSWHGRSMVAAWGVLAPLAIVITRFFKVMPGQNWPSELDNQFWWRSHWMGQSVVLLLTLIGLGLIFGASEGFNWHSATGYTILCLVAVQALLGVCRGSKGGPTAPAADGSLRGDHYDMTRWRLIFERLHKSLGYALLVLGVVTILSGLWSVNAPRWMLICLLLWWTTLAMVFIALQRKGWKIDTYQAIWGPDAIHPGNQPSLDRKRDRQLTQIERREVSNIKSAPNSAE